MDAARWYLLARSHDTTVDLDLDLAREQSSENPVYYVQYAHARIASMLAKAGTERVAAALARRRRVAAREPLHAAERALIELLLAFPAEVAEAAERRAPHRIAAYALELAQGFTAFYRDCRVVGAEPESVESVADRAVRGERAHDRALPGAARRERAAGDVASARARSRCARASQSKRARSALRRAASAAPSARMRRLPRRLRARPAAPARQQQREQRRAAPSTTASGTR